MAFHPETLQVRRGDTVVWINRDIVPHTATAAGPPSWDTGPLPRGKSGSYVVRRQGVEPYLCKLHPTMLGKLIVR
jgi:plastocyanin